MSFYLWLIQALNVAANNLDNTNCYTTAIAHNIEYNEHHKLIIYIHIVNIASKFISSLSFLFIVLFINFLVATNFIAMIISSLS